MMPRREAILGRLAAAAALAMAAGSAKAQLHPAQDDGPIIVGANKGKYVWWDLQRFTAEMQLYGEFHNEKQEIVGQPTQTVKDNRIQATLNCAFESYIGHKNLIDLTGTFKLGYEDHEITTTNPDGTTHEKPFVDYYNIEALILGEGPAPTTVYTLRDETITARDFTTSLTTDITETGAVVSLKSDKAPTRLQVFHRELDQTDDLTINDSSTQDTFSLQSGIQIAERQRLEISYEFDRISETQSNSFTNDYDRNDGAITHNWDFGKEREHNLRSYVRYYDQTGLFGQTDKRWDENLRLHHSDTLDTQYNLTVDDQLYGGTEQQLVAANASLRHKLYESLITTLRAGDNHLENPGIFQSNEVYTTAVFDYTKKVPYGRLDASMSLGFDQIDNGTRGGETFIINEPHTFVDPFPVILNHQNIIPSSIVMTNTARSYTFIQGSDYTVQTLPNSTELFRNLVGPNPPANGQTVLVNYEIGPEPGNTITTFSQGYSARYTVEEGWLKGLSPYVYYQQSDQNVVAVTPSLFVLDSYKDLRYGTEYKIGDFSFLAEQRTHRSEVQPFDEYRIEGRYQHNLGRDSSLAFELADDQVTYHINDQHVGVERAQGRWNQRLNEQFDFSIYLEYRNNLDSINGNVQGFQQAIEMRWHYGLTHAFVTFKNTNLEGQGTTRTAQELTLGVSRSF